MSDHGAHAALAKSRCWFYGWRKTGEKPSKHKRDQHFYSHKFQVRHGTIPKWSPIQLQPCATGLSFGVMGVLPRCSNQDILTCVKEVRSFLKWPDVSDCTSFSKSLSNSKNNIILLINIIHSYTHTLKHSNTQTLIHSYTQTLKHSLTPSFTILTRVEG